MELDDKYIIFHSINKVTIKEKRLTDPFRGFHTITFINMWLKIIGRKPGSICKKVKIPVACDCKYESECTVKALIFFKAPNNCQSIIIITYKLDNDKSSFSFCRQVHLSTLMNKRAMKQLPERDNVSLLENPIFMSWVLLGIPNRKTSSKLT